ncbi:hypothetical protein NE237_012569 [Protea cynaroides]|uniref:Uncharacterized protein n=1 Tax=Protea cynaroides TaxID=273540 RepID=A0A9Q0JXR1_9MAGN|nr:hypothetical protein NE237_012569 [Protea cynaroides]
MLAKAEQLPTKAEEAEKARDEMVAALDRLEAKRSKEVGMLWSRAKKAVSTTKLIKAQQAAAQASTALFPLGEGNYAVPLEAHAKAQNDVPPLPGNVPSTGEEVPGSSTEGVIPPLPLTNIGGMTSKFATGATPPNVEGLPPTLPPRKSTPSPETNFRVEGYPLE